MKSKQINNFFKGECNYGGRVTDEWDRRTLTTILSRYYTQDVISADEEFKLDESGTYYVPRVSEHAQFVEFAKSLPMIAEPEVFGMAENADIIKDQQATEEMLTSILLTQVRTFDPLLASLSL